MVVGGNRREPALPSGVNRLLEPPKREPFVSELHQRQVNSQIYVSIIPDFGAAARNPPARCPLSRDHLPRVAEREDGSSVGVLADLRGRYIKRRTGEDDSGYAADVGSRRFDHRGRISPGTAL